MTVPRADWETRFSKRDLAAADLPEVEIASLPAGMNALALVAFLFENVFQDVYKRQTGTGAACCCAAPVPGWPGKRGWMERLWHGWIGRGWTAWALSLIHISHADQLKKEQKDVQDYLAGKLTDKTTPAEALQVVKA